MTDNLVTSQRTAQRIVTTTPIKVAHLTFDMRIGGTERVILNLVLDHDHWHHVEHQVICIEQPLGPFIEPLKAANVRVISFARKPGFDVSLVRQIRRYLRQAKIDILHCHQYTPWSYGALAAMGTNTHVIFTEHGRFYPDRKSPKRRIINPLLAALTDQITAISAATKDALVANEYLSANRIQVIYNGIQGIDRQRLPACSVTLPERRFVFGTVARFDPIKNHPLMIRTIHGLRQRGLDAHLIIVGDGDTRPELERLIDELALDEAVTLAGYHANPHPLMAQFDAFLLTSFSEGTSMTLLEAMSLSLPCVVTAVGGNPEIIEHERSGLIIDSDNLSQSIESCSRLMNDVELRRTLGQRASQRFLERFSARAMNQRYQEIYRECS